MALLDDIPFILYFLCPMININFTNIPVSIQYALHKFNL